MPEAFTKRDRAVLKGVAEGRYLTIGDEALKEAVELLSLLVLQLDTRLTEAENQIENINIEKG